MQRRNSAQSREREQGEARDGAPILEYGEYPIAPRCGYVQSHVSFKLPLYIYGVDMRKQRTPDEDDVELLLISGYPRGSQARQAPKPIADERYTDLIEHSAMWIPVTALDRMMQWTRKGTAPSVCIGDQLARHVIPPLRSVPFLAVHGTRACKANPYGFEYIVSVIQPNGAVSVRASVGLAEDEHVLNLSRERGPRQLRADSKQLVCSIRDLVELLLQEPTARTHCVYTMHHYHTSEDARKKMLQEAEKEAQQETARRGPKRSRPRK